MSCDIVPLLQSNPYPGRGIVLGLSDDGKRSIALYFIMGRSENSRNRIFEKTEDGIRTKAFDPDKLMDPSLVIYHPVRSAGGITIVTNGAQTDTICTYLQNNLDFRGAINEWSFEPDPPINTPRISGIVERDGSYKLSIIKSAGGDPACCCRFFFDYPTAISGVGHFISTYETDGNPPPSFCGEPVAVRISYEYGLDSFADTVWNALNSDNKVSLYIRETVLFSGVYKDLIINKNI